MFKHDNIYLIIEVIIFDLKNIKITIFIKFTFFSLIRFLTNLFINSTNQTF